MKKILSLAFLALFFCKVYAEEALVRVKAKILTPLKLEVIQNINFGDIFKGGKNFIAKDTGELKVSGNGRVRLLWKDSLKEDYQPLDNELSIIMSDNKGNSFTALVSPNKIESLNDFIVNENSDKIVKINGKIEKLNKSLPEGDYSGTILIRAEYISN